MQPSPSKGLFLNTIKTCILTSTKNGASAIPAIRHLYGNALANVIADTNATFSNKPSPTPTNPSATTPVEVATGLRILGQLVGSKEFAATFFQDALQRVQGQVNPLFDSLSDKATILHLFAAYLRHEQDSAPLLGSEVLYFLEDVNQSEWDQWQGALTEGTHCLTTNFLARLANAPFIPHSSMLIAYMSIAQGRRHP